MVKRMTVWLTEKQYRLVEDYAKNNGVTKHKAVKVSIDKYFTMPVIDNPQEKTELSIKLALNSQGIKVVEK